MSANSPAPKHTRLTRFRARLRAMFERRRSPAPQQEASPPTADLPTAHADAAQHQLHHAAPAHPPHATPAHPPHAAPSAPPAHRQHEHAETVTPAAAPPLVDARTVQGTARSSDGATAPWLLLPPERAYRLYVPPRAADASAMPLVMMIHGCRETAEEFEQGTRMNAIAAREGFAVLYPDQATFANIRRCWNWFEPNTAAGHGECAILLEMINRARDELAVDVARVCVAGMSSGGALAGLLAYHHPEVFAAAAVHSGLPPMMPPSAAAAISAMEKGVKVDAEALADAYWNTHGVLPPALLVLHGDEDARVTERNATSMVRLWERLYESAPLARQLDRETRDVPADGNARAYTRTDLLRDGRIVIRGVRIHGLAHAWSGGDAELPFNDARGPDASAMIWRFFERQVRQVE
ncbi:MAG: PHB depolymerase family esterase [Burkholderiales bacterium]